MCEFFFGISPLIVGPGIKTGLNIKADNPKEVGADIIVNSVSAFTKYGGPIVVIDFGTATTFDVINDKGELLGVVIAPGIKTSLEGLASKTAQLPMVELDAPKTVIGKNTKHCMQAGIIFGFAGLVDNIIKRIKKELKLQDIKVIATGGLGEIIAKQSDTISLVDRTLTLDGLKTIYDLNK
jgi:type III pantothenate kinase